MVTEAGYRPSDRFGFEQSPAIRAIAAGARLGELLDMNRPSWVASAGLSGSQRWTDLLELWTVLQCAPGALLVSNVPPPSLLPILSPCNADSVTLKFLDAKTTSVILNTTRRSL